MFAGKLTASAKASKKPGALLCFAPKARVTPLESALPRRAHFGLVTPIESTRKLRISSYLANCAPVNLAYTTLADTGPRKSSRMNTSGKSMGDPTPHAQLTTAYSMDYTGFALRDLVRDALPNARKDFAVQHRSAAGAVFAHRFIDQRVEFAARQRH